MTETTLEEARRCPRCQFPGVYIGEQRIRKTGIAEGTKLQTFACANERCSWYGTTCRVIQINPDGSIPPPIMRRPKAFPVLPGVGDLSEQINARLARQIEAELAGGAEVKGPS
jgi:hypothetical protein